MKTLFNLLGDATVGDVGKVILIGIGVLFLWYLFVHFIFKWLVKWTRFNRTVLAILSVVIVTGAFWALSPTTTLALPDGVEIPYTVSAKTVILNWLNNLGVDTESATSESAASSEWVPWDEMSEEDQQAWIANKRAEEAAAKEEAVQNG